MKILRLVVLLVLASPCARAQEGGATLSSVSPNTASTCSSSLTITVLGTNFSQLNYPPGYAAVVYMDSIALSTTVNSGTQLTATIPASLLSQARTATITVRQLGGVTSTNSLPFTVTLGVQASIYSISPSSAIVGSGNINVTINGTGFDSSSTAYWGSNLSILPTTFVNSTTLIATVSSSRLTTAGTFNIVVRNACGYSSPSPFTVIGFSITSVNPATAATCGPDQQITVTGTGFQSGAIVRWNTTPLATTYYSSTSLIATIPASLLRSPGTASITVQNPSPLTSISNALSFTVTGSTPLITSLVPSSVYARSGATTLTVNGSGFTSAMTVRWGSTVLATTFRNSTQLTATIPANLLDSPGQVSITVGYDCGQSSPVTFTILPSPLSVTSLSPASAPGCGSGLALVVNGSGFQSGAVVRWNGIALSTNFLADSQLSATVTAALLAAPGPASITVRNADGTISTALPFTVTGSNPTIGSLSPLNIVAGSPTFTLTVSGSGFTSSMSITWQGIGLSTEFRSSSELGAIVPADLLRTPGKFLVSIHSPCGDSRTLEFEVLPASTSTITSISPKTAASCSTAIQLTITGTGFVPESEVRWNSTALVTTFVSATQLTAVIPATLLSPTGVARITVQSPGPLTTNAADFTVSAVTPVLTAISPATAAPGASAFTLRATGTGFAPTMTIRWGTTNLTTTFVSAQELTADVPAIPLTSPASIDVRVVNSCGAQSNAMTFTVAAGLSITSISPTSITAGSSATTLTVNGSGFVAASVIRWNSTALTTTFVNSTRLTAQVPASLLANAATAQITVANPGGQTTSSLNFTVTALPVITSLSPTSVNVGAAAFTLTVNGSGYSTSATVRWDTTSLATTFASATRLTAAVPASLLTTPATPTITVAQSGVTSNGVPFSVVLPPLPTITLTGLPASCATAQQHRPQLTLGAPYSLPMSGEFALTFRPADNLPGANDFLQNYRQVQFASGGTRSAFTIPAAGATVDLPMIQSGTVAGTITAAVTQLTCASTQVTPPSTTLQTIQVLPAAPRITTLEIVRNSTGFEVRIVGDSSIREVTEMTINFTGTGTSLQTTSLTVPLNTVFTAYFTSAASSAYGSTYQLIVPFTIDGQQTAVNSATVILRNRIGASAAVTAAF